MATPTGKALLQRQREFNGKMYSPVFVATNDKEATRIVAQLRNGGSFARKYKLTELERESIAFPPVHENPVKYIIYGRMR